MPKLNFVIDFLISMRMNFRDRSNCNMPKLNFVIDFLISMRMNGAAQNRIFG
jgi:hypothetical protein